ADRLILNGGEVEVQSGNTLVISGGVAINAGTLDVIGRLDSGVVIVGVGGTLDVSGELNVGAMTAGGSMSFAPAASVSVGVVLTVDGTALDMGGGALTMAPGSVLAVQNAGSLDMNGGTLTADGAGIFVGNDAMPGDTAALTIDNAVTVSSLVLRNGGSLNHQNNNVTVTDALVLSGSDLDMTGATLGTAGADVTIGSTLTVDNQTLMAASLDLQGTLVRTGANRDVVIADSLNLGADLDMTGGALDVSTAAVTVGLGRTLTVDQGGIAVRSLDLSAHGKLDTRGDNDVTLTGDLALPDAQFSHTGGGSFTAAWNDTKGRPTQLTLNGGDLTAAMAGSMYWSFNDPCDPYNDSAPGGTHDGVVMGTAPAWLAGGYAGGAVSFDGNQNGLAPMDDWFMKVAKTALSVGLWIEQDANTSGLQMVMDEGGATNGLALVVEEGVLRAGVRSSGTPDTYVFGDAPLTEGWHHVGLVFGRQPGLFELYLDGALIDSNTFGLDTIAQHTDGPGIGYLEGSGPYTSADRYRGLMDELVYFERAISADEMLDASLGAPRIDLKDLDVAVQSDSNMTLASLVDFGALKFNADAALKLDGQPVRFARGVLNGASAVTIDNDNDVLLTRDANMDFGGADGTITKAGLGRLVLTRPVTNLGAGVSKFVVRNGSLALSEPGLLGAAGVELDGGSVLLSSPAGAPTQTYSLPLTFAGDGAIRAGKATDDSQDAAAIAYDNPLNVPAGRELTLGTADGYTLELTQAVTASKLRVDQGQVQLSAGATVPEGGQVTLGVSSYQATTGTFQVLGALSPDSAETIVLGGAGSVLTVESPGPVTFQGASIGDDTHANFPTGGSLATDPIRNPTYSVTASGTDIWDSADGLYFAFEEFDASQSIDISARVGVGGFVGGSNAWRKAGLMVRGSLDPNARNGFMLIASSNSNGLNAQIRPSDEVSTLGSGEGTGTRTSHDTPVFLRITYDGDGRTFNMYWRDGEADPWTLQGTNLLDANLTGTIYAGLAATSHNTSQQTTVAFDTLAGDFSFEAPITRVNNVVGEGTIVGSLAIAGDLAPGNSTGTVFTDSVLFEDGSSYTAQFGEDASDLLTISGDLTIGEGGADLPDLVLVELSTPTVAEYTLMTWTGTRMGEFDADASPYQLVYDAHALRLVIPEPATMALLVVGAAALISRRRRR
ncbi:MAG TPA: LamG-like jellyroll fold domain-containing protein, partial [Phycisphaerae bacterium]|nr:LamG-like jellyroll fold domain-containing protein [Phycisphaerae bacterium]